MKCQTIFDKVHLIIFFSDHLPEAGCEIQIEYDRMMDDEGPLAKDQPEAKPRAVSKLIMSGPCLGPIWATYETCVGNVWTMSGPYLDHVWAMFEPCMGHV